MHDLLVATAFVAMLVVPAFMAFGGFRDRNNFIE